MHTPSCVLKALQAWMSRPEEKIKDKRFAAGCNRDVIKKGFEMLGLDQNVVMQAAIDGMTEHKDELGLK